MRILLVLMCSNFKKFGIPSNIEIGGTLLLVIYRVTEDAIEMHTSTLIYPEHNFQRGALFNYVDQILPIIDRLPTPG